ncbi:hypothetical protein DL93DRAFT_1093947 [Clavulina sp. PMI_390]|nr:hypothetical protein DL93DRAFT_1093947 [Clavulina sp. PMI_390]
MFSGEDLPLLTRQSHFDRINTFLDRSMSTPMTLWLNRVAFPSILSKTEIEDTESEWRSVFHLLEPHMNRCRRIFVFNYAEEPSTMITELFQLLQAPKFPILEEFLFCDPRLTPSEAYQNAIEGPWNISYSTSPLKRLRFMYMLGYLPKSFDVVWPNMKRLHLNLHHSQWPKVCTTLAKLPSLEDLQIWLKMETAIDLSSDTALFISPSRLVLPRLSVISTNYLLSWLDIHTPAVSRIVFYGVYSYSPSSDSGLEADSPAFLQSLAGMRTSVREVEFRASLVQGHIMLPILHELDRIEVLIFHGCFLLHDVISHLISTRQIGPSPLSSHAPVELGIDHPSESNNPSDIKRGFLPLLKVIKFSGEMTVPDPGGFRKLVEKLESASTGLQVQWEVTNLRKEGYI